MSLFALFQHHFAYSWSLYNALFAFSSRICLGSHANIDRKHKNYKL